MLQNPFTNSGTWPQQDSENHHGFPPVSPPFPPESWLLCPQEGGGAGHSCRQIDVSFGFELPRTKIHLLDSMVFTSRFLPFLLTWELNPWLCHATFQTRAHAHTRLPPPYPKTWPPSCPKHETICSHHFGITDHLKNVWEASIYPEKCQHKYV